MASEFEKAIIDAAQQSVIKLFREGLIAPDYANRIKLPAELVQKVYALIDHDEILAALRQEINAIAAKTIVNSMVTEITNDVKKVLCHEPTRLHLRVVVARELEALRVAAE
jgi:hypothetical protein